MTFGVSTAFRSAYENSHLVVATGTLLGPDGAAIADLTLDRRGSNQVQIDVTAANRRRCTLALVDDGNLAPVTPNSNLALVNEIVLARGIQFADGTTEMAQLGIFGIQSAQEADTPAGPVITVEGIDRSKRLDVPLLKGISFPAGTDFDVVFTELADASGVIYDKSFDPSVPAAVTPALVFNAGDNIWQQIQTAASSLGCWAYFDVFGVLTVIPVPDPDGAEVDWAYAAGAEAVFDQTQRRIALEDGSQKAYSHAVIESNVHGTGAPLRSDAYDLDPSSPTYVLGPFGDRAIFDSGVSGFIVNQPQADTAAAALLRRNYGIVERVTMQAAPNPALEGGDVISITDPITDTDGVYITEQVPIPLFASGGLMTVTVRARQLHG